MFEKSKSALIFKNLKKFNKLKNANKKMLSCDYPKLDITEEILNLIGEVHLLFGRLHEKILSLPQDSKLLRALTLKVAANLAELDDREVSFTELFTYIVTNRCKKKNRDSFKKALVYNSLLLKLRKEFHKSTISLDFVKMIHSIGFSDLDNSITAENEIYLQNLIEYINKDNSNNEFTAHRILRLISSLMQFHIISPLTKGNEATCDIISIYFFMKIGLLSAPVIPISSFYTSQFICECNLKHENIAEGNFNSWIISYLKYLNSKLKCVLNIISSEIELRNKISEIILNDERFYKMRKTSMTSFLVLFNSPIVSILDLSILIKRAYNTSHEIINKFVEIGILEQLKEQKRNKYYVFRPYIDLFK